MYLQTVRTNIDR